MTCARGNSTTSSEWSISAANGLMPSLLGPLGFHQLTAGPCRLTAGRPARVRVPAAAGAAVSVGVKPKMTGTQPASSARK